MKKILKISTTLLLFAVILSCSDDENPADNFLGKQDVLITLNGDSFPMKGGEYYKSTNESNCDITEIKHLGSSAEFSFKLENSTNFERFSFNYQSTFNGDPVALGETIVNPWFFAYSFKLTNEDSYYVGAMIDGESNTGNTSGYPDNAVLVTIENVSLVINKRVSNGNEQVIDGVRQEYPLEKVSGVLTIEFTDEAGERQNVSMDFDLEGDNIVIEPDENIFSDPVGDGSGDGGGSGGTDCGNLVYTGPTEGQIMQWCQAAQLYQCLGATNELMYVCDALAEYGGSCSYCN
jgi:hypothetical protein